MQSKGNLSELEAEKEFNQRKKELEKQLDEQIKLRKTLVSEKVLVQELNKIIEKRRHYRYEEKMNILAMRQTVLDNNIVKMGYQYLLENCLEWFDVGRIPNDASVIQVGKKGTGKTMCTDFILYTKRKVFPFVYMFSMTTYNGFWKRRIHPDFILDDWENEDEMNDFLVELMRRQKNTLENPSRGEDPRIAVILDDMAAEKGVKDNLQMRRLAFYGRHLKVFVAITTQYYKKGLSTDYRQNADVIFLYQMDNDIERKAIWAEHSAGVPWKIFEAMMNRYSTEKSCMVILKNASRPLNKFFCFRAPVIGPYRLGCAACWEDE